MIGLKQVEISKQVIDSIRLSKRISVELCSSAMGYNDRKVGANCYYHKVFISKQKKMTTKHLIKLARIFGVKINDILMKYENNNHEYDDLRHARIAHKLTQLELAKQTGIRVAKVRNIEQDGVNPNPEELATLCLFFSAKAESFL